MNGDEHREKLRQKALASGWAANFGARLDGRGGTILRVNPTPRTS